MSYPFGGRSSFRDIPMGKSEDEVFDDMLENINQRKKQFFKSPRWRSTGMFDDEVGAGGSRLKAHLDELATRHPELAGHLSDWLPEASNSGTVPKRRTKAESSKNTPNKYFTEEESKSSPVTATVGTQTSSIETGGGGLESDIKLRSTVPDMQSSASDATDGDRGQRSQSAPPQSSVPSKSQQNEEPERIIPIQTDASGNYPGVHQMPRQASQAFSSQSPHFPSSQQTFQQSSQFPEEESPSSSGKKPNVRHIPIFVEGRDEPLLPRDTNQNSSKRGGCQGKPDPHKRPPEQNHHEQFPHHPQQQFHQQQQPPYPQKHQPPYTQKQHSQHPQEQQPQQTPPPQPPQPPQKPDPLTLVAEIVKEVDALRSKVNEWNGTSRTDKEYIYLDEMLTRNLLKLDNIETEGKEEVRNARKDAIRRIQDAINVLESKTDNKAMNCENQVPESGGSGKEKMEVTEIDSQSEQSQSTQESSTSNATQT